MSNGEPKSSTDSRAVVVLGMHRSGTSALAGSLARAGVRLGETCEPSEDNPRGNQESRRVMTLHEDIFERNGGAWDRPASNPRWSAVHRELRDAIVESRRDVPLWGFKDPRTLFTVGGWLPALPNAALVGIFRHPSLVASSLERRNGMPLEEGLSLWTAYNRVLAWHLDRRESLTLLEFSASASLFEGQLAVLFAHLGLPEPTDGFFEPSLRHDTVPELAPGPEANAALALYERLRTHPNHTRCLRDVPRAA